MRIRVHGGHPLNGTYTPSPSPAAAAAHLAAALLTDQPVTLSLLPQDYRTQALIKLAGWLGAATSGSGQPDGAPLELITDGLSAAHLPSEALFGAEGGLLFSAPLLARGGMVSFTVDFPVSRLRTVLHLLRDLGQVVSVSDDGRVELMARRWERADVLLAQPTPTATAYALLLAAKLGRETVIRNAACDPHINDLAGMLTAMGAQVEGRGSNVLTVIGAPTLTGAAVRVCADPVEAASVLAVIGMTGGAGAVASDHTDYRAIRGVFEQMGVPLTEKGGAVSVDGSAVSGAPPLATDDETPVESAPWPGFPSELLPIATVMATQRAGTTLIHERMAANRLLFVDKLKGMGAQIVLCDPHRALVMGKTRLLRTYHDTPEPHAGMAVLAAALIAEGETTIDNAELLEERFGGLFDKLRALGAQIVSEEG